MTALMKVPEITRYELPEGGTSLLGYVVRRMHKTERLEAALRHLEAGRRAEALLDIALYAAASSTSFGPAFYQPTFNDVGEEVSEPDPATGAAVSATLVGRSPHYDIRTEVRLKGGAHFNGREKILGTTFGVRGLGMPAPSQFEFATADNAYVVRLTGTLTSELALGLFRGTRIRAYGRLEFRDNLGGVGTLTLARSGRAQASAEAAGDSRERTMDLSTSARVLGEGSA
jgi:hypothetical protein